MEYHGKLYGKFGNRFFDTGKTAEDFDELKEFVNQVVNLIPLLEYPKYVKSEHEGEAIAVRSLLDRSIILSNKK